MSCPGHRRNKATACSKYLTLSANTVDEDNKVIRQLKRWAVGAHAYDRQWKHVHLLDARMITEFPTTVVLTVDQLGTVEARAR